MKASFLAIAVACALSTSAVAVEPASDPNAAEAKTIVMEFFTSLKGELAGAIEAEGPVSAIGVCKDRAPAIARELSEKFGWDVGRTALKLRNPALNAPDDWERQVLVRFEARKAAGEDVKTMAYSEVVDTGGGERYRFMKAIPTADLCLACHGETINPDIAAAVDEAYPEDQARGFKAGDIRGAFTLSKPL